MMQIAPRSLDDPTSRLSAGILKFVCLACCLLWVHSSAHASLASVPDDVNRWANAMVPASGCNGEIRALAETGDGNSRIVVAGDFTVCADLRVDHIALYDPINNLFERLGKDDDFGVNGPVNAVLVHNNIIYAGGTFTQAGGTATPAIAQYNPSTQTWSGLDAGITSSSPTVNDVVIYNDDLYVGGQFSQISGQSAANIGAWDIDGGVWLAAIPGTNGQIKTMLVADDGSGGEQIYVGGNFTSDSTITTNHIAAFKNGSWAALNTPSTVAAPVNDLAFYDNRVFAVGETQNLVAYTPSSGNWSADLSNRGITIIPSSTGLYFSGEIDPTVPDNYDPIKLTWNSEDQEFTAARLIGTTTGQDIDSPAKALLLVGNQLWMGGAMQRAGNLAVHGLAIWNEVSDEYEVVEPSTGEGLSRIGRVLTNIEGDIYVGGDFISAGNTAAPGIAQWTGSQWESLSNVPLIGTRAITKHADTLWAGGEFEVGNIGSLPTTLAKYDEANSLWLSLDDEPSSTAPATAEVRALASWNDLLVVAGEWENIGNLNQSRLASCDVSLGNGRCKWNEWDRLGGVDPNGAVNALAVDGTDLYVGGVFTQLGGSGTLANIKAIGRYDGTTWSTLATGMNGAVNAIAIQKLTLPDESIQTNIFAGGSFTEAGGNTVSNIARWDGAGWQPLGDGLNGTVTALAVYEDLLFAAGEFTASTDGSTSKTLSYVARWDGTEWTSLAGGVNGAGQGVAVNTIGEVFVTGQFDRTSLGPSTRVAIYNVPTCAEGTFSGSGFQPCQACPEGQFTPFTQSTSCEACPETRQPTEDARSCELCPAGTRSPGDGTVCEACPSGQVQPLTGQTTCVACDQGQYQDQAGQTTCKACELGTANNGFGATACTDCDPGTYADEPGLTECKTCPLGEHQPGFKATSCLDCEPGRQGSADRTSCEACPLGTFSDEAGEACQDCPAGKIAASQGLTECVLCEQGQYQPAAGNSSCLDCAAGKQGSADRTACENCGVGTSSLAGQGCLDCPAGTFQDEEGQGTCKNCGGGRYQPETGKTVCLNCPAGTFNNQPAVSVCQACQPGTFTNYTGAFACLNCEPGRYAPEPGASECLLCEGTTNTGEAAGASQCTSAIIFIDRFQQGAWFLPKAKCLAVSQPSRV